MPSDPLGQAGRQINIALTSLATYAVALSCIASVQGLVRQACRSGDEAPTAPRLAGGDDGA